MSEKEFKKIQNGDLIICTGNGKEKGKIFQIINKISWSKALVKIVDGTLEEVSNFDAKNRRHDNQMMELSFYVMKKV